MAPCIDTFMRCMYVARHRFWATFVEIQESPLTGLVSFQTDSSAVNVHLRWSPTFSVLNCFQVVLFIYLFFSLSPLSPPLSSSSPSPLPLFITVVLQVAIFSLQDRYKWHHSTEKKQERMAWWHSSPPCFFFFFLALPAQWSDQKMSTVRAHIQVGAMHMTPKPSRNAKMTPSRSCCSLLLRPTCVDYEAICFQSNILKSQISRIYTVLSHKFFLGEFFLT